MTSTELPYTPTPYPPEPWQMVGSMWLTVFRLGRSSDPVRPAGVFGAAFVSYEEGSPLTYSELLVARALPGSRGGRVTITDIWVDSPASVAGGRELWAIPKGLSSFERDTSRTGPLTRTEWRATREDRPVASARFGDVSAVVPRTPFKGVTHQPGLPEGGGDKRAVLQGTARSFPARGRWDFAADGPLAFLRAARPLATVRMADFHMRFGAHD